MSQTAEARLITAISPKRKPRILHHYTSAVGLMGILESRSIWATNIRFLNDSTEYSFALKMAHSLIQDRLSKTRNQFDRALITVLDERINVDVQAEVYVSSFTENADQLSQWRAYCPSSGGYAIGFRTKSLVKSTDSNPDRFLARCFYDMSSQQQLINNLIQAVTESADDALHAKLPHDRVYREAFKQVGRLLRWVAPSLKDSSFAEEQEWRLVRLPDSFGDVHPDFRQGRSLLIPYHQHTFPVTNDSLPIEELVIGPTPHPELALEAAESLLSSYGLTSTKIRSSSIPYRSW